MQNHDVGTPVFYTNTIEYLIAVGSEISIADETNYSKSLYYTLPVDMSNQTGSYNNYDDTAIRFNGFQRAFSGNNFIAVLGHENGGQKIQFRGKLDNGSEEDFYSNYSIDPYVNSGTPASTGFSIPSDGWSMWRDGNIDFSEFKELGIKMMLAGYSRNYGSVIFGNYYTMPHSPDINVKMTWEMDGAKSSRTKAGTELTGFKYIRSPNWGSLGAWELLSVDAGEANSLTRQGRRIWDISYSQLSSSDVFPNLANLNYEGSAYNSTTVVGNNLFGGNSFYGDVLERTLGGKLPFIFQPNSDNKNPDQFAICKLDNVKFDQVANGVYKCNIRVREVW